MTHKAEAQLNYCWQKIVDETFDQETISTLLVNLRDFVPKESFTRELGDFVAHPEKDRGIALSHAEILEVKTENGVWHFMIPAPREGKKLIEELSLAITKLATQGQEEISTTLAKNGDDILLCYLGILHFTTLLKKAKGRPAKIVGLLRAKSMGSELYLGTTIRTQNSGEILLISTNLVKYLKCAFDPRELDRNHLVIAARGEGGLKLRLIGG